LPRPHNGFDYEKARINLEIPDNFDVMAMIAIGKKGPKDNLPQVRPRMDWKSNSSRNVRCRRSAHPSRPTLANNHSFKLLNLQIASSCLLL